ncbi:MAG: metal-dependent transcriptional regulator [Cyclobacteriaceae bacterium]
MKLSLTEENYIKSIYHLSADGENAVSTSAISEDIETKPASVTDMVKKLADKGILKYEKYYGVQLSNDGKSTALEIIRRHRLWEVFLVEKLGFNWDEVHDVAEQMEHIQSSLLIDRLDDFLGNPIMDPHGDPIPDKDGNIIITPQMPLSELSIGESGKVVNVPDSDPSLLRHLDKIKIKLGSVLKVIDVTEFDKSILIQIDKNHEQYLSDQIAKSLMIAKK